jgi:hypothetical protein
MGSSARQQVVPIAFRLMTRNERKPERISNFRTNTKGCAAARASVHRSVETRRLKQAKAMKLQTGRSSRLGHLGPEGEVRRTRTSSLSLGSSLITIRRID